MNQPIRKNQKAIVTQDNRFIYAKYDMSTNEMKFFMWIIAQLNSQKDSLFQVCEMPLKQIFEIFNHNNNENYNYIKNLIDNMAKKVYIEDFKLLDEMTMKETEIHRAMPLFEFIEYKRGEAYIKYKLNNSLMEYLLDLRKNFTQIKFNDIQYMKSAYSIRIYNMLLCELKQNHQNLKINISILQNILEVPKTLQEYRNFNQKILKQVTKDINAKSNIVLFEIRTYKTDRKITDLEFIFDYKNNDKRIAREKERKLAYLRHLIKIIDEQYCGKSIYLKGYGELVITHYNYDKNRADKLLVYTQRKSDDKKIFFNVRNFKDINDLEKAKDKAEELFYLNEERVLKAKETKAYFNTLI